MLSLLLLYRGIDSINSCFTYYCIIVVAAACTRINIAVDVDVAVAVPYRGIDSIRFDSFRFDSMHSCFTNPSLVVVIK